MKVLLVLMSLVFSISSFAEIPWKSYSASSVKNAQGNLVVLGFHKRGCPACRSMDAELDSTGITNLQGVTFLKVDKSSQNSVFQQYGMNAQTALVLLDKNGKEIKPARVKPFQASSSNIANFASVTRKSLNR